MDIQTIIFLVIIIVISLSLHEYAHAWMADRLGDPTPRMQGRLTPNPLAHIDPLGLLMIFVIHFGWGKPVVTNPSYFKDPIKGDFLVAMAGPLTNLILAFCGGVIMMVYGKILGIPSAYELLQTGDIVLQFWGLFTVINIGIAVFNLLPIYPLDGYRFIKIISPSAGYWMEKNGYILQFVMIFLVVGVGSSVISNIVSWLSDKIVSVLFIFLSHIFY